MLEGDGRYQGKRLACLGEVRITRQGDHQKHYPRDPAPSGTPPDFSPGARSVMNLSLVLGARVDAGRRNTSFALSSSQQALLAPQQIRRRTPRCRKGRGCSTSTSHPRNSSLQTTSPARNPCPVVLVRSPPRDPVIIPGLLAGERPVRVIRAHGIPILQVPDGASSYVGTGGNDGVAAAGRAMNPVSAETKARSATTRLSLRLLPFASLFPSPV